VSLTQCDVGQISCYKNSSLWFKLCKANHWPFKHWGRCRSGCNQ